MVKAIMHGCNGKMGRVITDLIKADENIEIVAGVDAYTAVPNDYPVFEKIADCDVEADVVIDFSNASAVDGVLAYCTEKQVPVVLCTTGLSEAQLEEVKESSKKVAILKSANMSVGINLLLKLLQKAAKVLGPAGYDIELVERHHNQKLDAPSGTALALADSFGCTVNDLPLTLVLSWYEQKAVCILLSLLALGVKNIYLGPTLPAFLSETVVKTLVDAYGLQPITAPQQDLDAILHRG